MTDVSRRRLLRAAGGAAASVAATASLAGCLSETGGLSKTEPTHTASSTTPEKPADEGTGLAAWERSTDCVTSGERDDMDSMYDSVVSVQHVVDELDDDYAPIHYADCTGVEQEMLDAVTTEGGYATCEPGDAFNRFLDRVLEHLDRQDDRTVHLERDGTYYGLYVEEADQVFSY